eukprot:scaffold8_cov249-Pinguiococcus_pyrenoidosus.AAC.16
MRRYVSSVSSVKSERPPPATAADSGGGSALVERGSGCATAWMLRIAAFGAPSTSLASSWEICLSRSTGAVGEEQEGAPFHWQLAVGSWQLVVRTTSPASLVFVLVQGATSPTIRKPLLVGLFAAHRACEPPQAHRT